MKVTIKTESLINAVRIASQALGFGKVTLPAWEHLYFSIKGEKCHIYARNGAIQIKTFCTVKSDEDHDICVPGKLFFDTIKLLSDDEIILKTTVKEQEKSTLFKTQVTVKGQKKKYNMTGINPKEFSIMKMDKEEAKVATLRGESFMKAVNNVAGSVSTNTIKPQLAGISVRSQDKNLEIIATNQSYVMGIMFIENNDNIEPVIIPKNAVSVLESIPLSPEIKLSSDKNKIGISTGAVNLICTKMSEDYPPCYPLYRVIDRDMYIVVDRQELIDSMKRLKLYSFVESDSKFAKNQMVCKLEGNTLNIGASDSFSDNSASEDMEVESKNATDLTIGLNPVFLLEALNAMETEKIRISMPSPKKGVFVTEHGDSIGKDPEQLWLVMPIALPEHMMNG